MKKTLYLVPKAAQVTTQHFKKCRFLTYLDACETVSQAKEKIAEIRAAHPKARHWCYAYIAGNPTDPHSLGFSDDGEPSGTAGKPMLAQLTGSGFGEILAVVVRYYGGVQLGTGGLVKAYGGGVQFGLSQLAGIEKVSRTRFHLTCDYVHINLIETFMARFNGIQLRRDFDHTVTMTVEIDAWCADAFVEGLYQSSKGQISCTQL